MDEIRIQRVIFLRHGVARHNIRDPVTGETPDIYNPEFFDADLVEQGTAQVRSVKRRLTNSGILTNIELVLISPLTRCLQTAQLIFDYFVPPSLSSSSMPPPPMVCLQDVREAYGMHYPDKRRDKSMLRTQFPSVHFDVDTTMTEKDEKWSINSRVTVGCVVKRIHNVLEWIVQRHEATIFVVTHGVWIECLLNAYVPVILKDGSRVNNCDCYAADIVSGKDGGGTYTFVRMQNVVKI